VEPLAIGIAQDAEALESIKIDVIEIRRATFIVILVWYEASQDRIIGAGLKYAPRCIQSIAVSMKGDTCDFRLAHHSD
jgi:hypothetical protein